MTRFLSAGLVGVASGREDRDGDTMILSGKKNGKERQRGKETMSWHRRIRPIAIVGHFGFSKVEKSNFNLKEIVLTVYMYRFLSKVQYSHKIYSATKDSFSHPENSM